MKEMKSLKAYEAPQVEMMFFNANPLMGADPSATTSDEDDNEDDAAAKGNYDDQDGLVEIEYSLWD